MMWRRRSGKSILNKLSIEFALANKKTVCVIHKDGKTIIHPGPWQYIPSWMRSEGVDNSKEQERDDEKDC